MLVAAPDIVAVRVRLYMLPFGGENAVKVYNRSRQVVATIPTRLTHTEYGFQAMEANYM